MTYPPPKALLRLPPSRNKKVRSGIAAIKVQLRRNLLQEAAVQLQQLQQLDTGNVEIALLQAELLTRAGDHDRSCQLLKQILSRHPGMVPALALSAQAHTAAQRHLDALDALQLAHELAPKDQNIARQLADTLALLKRPSTAAAVFAPLVRKSATPADIARLAALHDRAGNLEDCLAAYDNIKQPLAETHVLKAGALLVRGERQRALVSIEAALQADPDSASARLFIAKNFADDFGSAEQAREIEAVLTAADSTGLSVEDRARLGFALGLHHERAGNFADAFRAIEQANRLAAPDSFAKDQQLEKVALGIAEHFSKSRLAQLAPAGNASQKPVFVSGLPRSGTTLVEQMIASHPEAASVGELELIPALKQSLVSLQSRAIERCAQAWLDAIPEDNSGSARIVDKSISTVLHTGLAMLMFPNSRFVFLRRHPMDTYWSAYREMFGANALTFTYAPQALVRHMKLSEHLMTVWRQRFPDRILTLKYEGLVEDPERQIRNIIDHIGVDWSEDCLHFHKSKTVVRTTSMAQVRQPVFKSSIGRWQAYRSQLAPVAEALADLITEHEKTSD